MSTPAIYFRFPHRRSITDPSPCKQFKRASFRLNTRWVRHTPSRFLYISAFLQVRISIGSLLPGRGHRPNVDSYMNPFLRLDLERRQY